MLLDLASWGLGLGSSTRQEYSDGGAFPRLAFRVVRLGHVEVLRWMLESGVDPDTPNRHGESLLHYAAGFQASARRTAPGGPAAGLLPPGAEADICRSAAGGGAAGGGGGGGSGDNRGAGSRMVEMLLAHGAAPLVATLEGVTPLHLASLGDLAATRALAAAGGAPLLSARTGAGLTAADLARLGNHTAGAEAVSEFLAAEAARLGLDLDEAGGEDDELPDLSGDGKGGPAAADEGGSALAPAKKTKKKKKGKK